MIHPDEIKNLFTEPKEPFVGEHWYFGHECWKPANSEQICEFYRGEKANYLNASHFWFSASEKVCGCVTKDHLTTYHP